MSKTQRRADDAILLSAPTAPDCQSADGQLLVWCAAARATDKLSEELVRPFEDMIESCPEWDAAIAASQEIAAVYHNAVEQATKLPARTAEGLRAKAELVLGHLSDDANSSAIALSLARDVLARA